MKPGRGPFDRSLGTRACRIDPAAEPEHVGCDREAGIDLWIVTKHFRRRVGAPGKILRPNDLDVAPAQLRGLEDVIEHADMGPSLLLNGNGFAFQVGEVQAPSWRPYDRRQTRSSAG